MEMCECKQVADLYQTQLQKERRRIHCWINRAKYFLIYQSYIGTLIGSYSSDDPQQKSQSSTAKLNWTYGKLFWM